MHDANDVISPLLGLPQLPVVDLDEAQIDATQWNQLNWKTEGLVEVAAGRPFVWIDDEISGTDRTWVAETTRARRFCSGSTPTLDSPKPTSPQSSDGCKISEIRTAHTTLRSWRSPDGPTHQLTWHTADAIYLPAYLLAGEHSPAQGVEETQTASAGAASMAVSVVAVVHSAEGAFAPLKHWATVVSKTRTDSY